MPCIGPSPPGEALLDPSPPGPPRQTCRIPEDALEFTEATSEEDVDHEERACATNAPTRRLPAPHERSRPEWCSTPGTRCSKGSVREGEADREAKPLGRIPSSEPVSSEQVRLDEDAEPEVYGLAIVHYAHRASQSGTAHDGAWLLEDVVLRSIDS